jgi:hypothetical protein
MVAAYFLSERQETLREDAHSRKMKLLPVATALGAWISHGKSKPIMFYFC